MASTLITTISCLVFPATLLILIFLYAYNGNDVVLLSASNLSTAANDLKVAAVPPAPLKKLQPPLSSSANATIAKIKNPHTIANNIKNQKRNNSSLWRIEKDLGEARRAIRRAIRRRNFTSEKEEIFVPRGNVYRNA